MSLAASAAFMNPSGLATSASISEHRTAITPSVPSFLSSNGAWVIGCPCGQAGHALKDCPNGGTSNAALKRLQSPSLQSASSPSGRSSVAPLVGAAIGLLGGVCSRIGTKTKPRMRASRGAAATDSASSVPFDPSKAEGVLAPLGYWDPAGLMKEPIDKETVDPITLVPSSGYQWKDKATFQKYRVMELKHGRLAMLGVTGMLTTAFTKFPGDEFQYSPEGFNAFQSPAAAGIGIIFILCGGIELNTPKGDFKDPLGLGAYDNVAESPFLREAELAHGRLGMSAALIFLLCNYSSTGDGLVPSDVLRFSPVQPGSPFVLAAAAFLLLAWTNPQGMGTATPDGYVTFGSKVLVDSSRASRAVQIKASLPEKAETEPEKVNAVA